MSMGKLANLIRGFGATALAIGGYFGVTELSVAQSAPTANSASQVSANQLEEVVVTAQKRSENLQNVPISVQVISGQTLAEQNFNSFEDLTQTVPGVHISLGPSSGGDNIFIRGVGTTAGAAAEQSVALFTDDIYHGRSLLSNATFLDLDRIEVLKGPQSTFFGNNAIAGALNIVTKNPGDAFEAWGRALYGQHGQYAAEGAVGGPITDTFGVRVAVTRNGDGGWIDNVNLGQEAPRINNEAARITLVYKPIEALDITLKSEGSQSRTAGSSAQEPLQWTNCPPPAPFTPGFNGEGLCPEAIALHVPIGLGNNDTTSLAGQGNSLSTSQDILTINYRQWDQTFTSVSGYYDYHFNQDIDFNFLPVDAFGTGIAPEQGFQLSQEFRVASPLGGLIEYQAGVYYEDSQFSFVNEATVPGFGNLGSAALNPYLPLATSDEELQYEHEYSVFGSLSWNATDRLKLIAGLRGTEVTKAAYRIHTLGTGTELYGGLTPLPAAVLPIAEAALVEAGTSPTINLSERALMPSANIQYKLNSQAMVYFRFDRGFKAGGTNPPGGLFDSASNFGPEHVDAYELGLKSTWFENRLLFNFDVFRSNYKDLQVTSNVYDAAVNATTQATANAAASVSEGVELETQWLIMEGVRVGANVTYLDSHYTNYPNAPQTTLQSFCAVSYVLPYCSIFPNPVPATANLSGQPTLYSPRWSGSLNASYSTPIQSDYKFTAQLSPYFTTSYGNDPQLQAIGLGYLSGTGGYVRLDGGLTFAASNNRWAVDLIGKNLTNRIIIDNGMSFPNASKEEPRNIALQARYRY
jgi:iron complex outermembrane recepter protein